MNKKKDAKNQRSEGKETENTVNTTDNNGTQEKECANPNQQADNNQNDKNHSEAEAEEEDAKATQGEEKSDDPTLILQKELDETKDKYIRLSAEFDNFRKRTLKEKADLIKYATEDVLKALLPIMDDFERAIQNTDKSTDVESLKEGIKLIHIKVNDFLKEKGIHEIDAIGKELDTDVHEAIAKTPSDDKSKKGKIVDVIEKGYKLNDKVIRFAKVVVGE